MKSLYESVLSGITKLIDKQISGFESAKNAAVESLETERSERIKVLEEQQKQIDLQIKAKEKVISGIEEEINAIREANQERQRQLQLQQAEYNLAKMEAQRSILQYSSDKGLTYVTDTSKLREARQEVEDTKLEIEIANKEKQIKLIENEIDLLQEKRDLLDDQIDQINEYYDQLISDTEKYWDSMIKNMEDYRSRWEELTSIFEDAEMRSIFEQLGISIEDVLNMSGEAFEKFKGEYVGILADLYRDNDSMTNALAQSLGTTTDKLGSYIQATQGYIDSLGGSADSIQPVSDAIDNASSSMDNLSSSASTAGKSVSDTAKNLDTAATNAGTLRDNLTDVNTVLSDEQTAFGNLKQKIDEVIQAINDKIEAIQDEQNAVNIATSREMADFLLLRDKILEVKESIDDIGNTVTDLDANTLDNLTNSFQLLYNNIILVSGSLGSGIEGSGESVTNSIASAIQALNDISLEEGIIAQFNNLKEAIDSVTSAISGGGGESSGREGQGGQSGSGSSGSNSGKGSEGNGSGSLTDAITTMGGTASKVIGTPEAEGDGTVIGEFGSLKTAVNDVSEAIGIGGDEGSGDSSQSGDNGTLIGSINDLGTTTEETLGESGGEGVIGKFGEFKDVIVEAEDHVKGISNALDELDGKEVTCTISINVEMNGSIPAGIGLADGTAFNSADYVAKYGSAHVEGTALASGNWAVQSDEKSALMGEIGYEIIVKFLRLYIVIYIENLFNCWEAVRVNSATT